MTTDNTIASAGTTTASDAKKGKTAFIVGVIALIVSPVSILGWIMGAIALGLGFVASKIPASAKQAKTAMILGAAAILIGVFFYTLNVAMFS